MATRMKSEAELTAERKQAHLDLCLREDVGTERKTTLLEEVELVHEALPDLDWDDLDITSRWLGKTLRAPLLITGMTGGTEQAGRVNHEIAAIAEELGIAFGVGSQRAMLSRPSSADSYAIRDVAPNTVLLANIGLAQACTMELAEFEGLVDTLGADALCLHLNVGQELIQPEGDRAFRGGEEAFRRLAAGLRVPVIAKETGCGMARRTAERLKEAGVRHVDISGAGGTSWIRIEALRDDPDTGPGATFREWGIPTAASVLQVSGLGMTTIASGGIRNGLDVARAVSLGASICGMALPVYQAWQSGGPDGARLFLKQVIHELRIAMLLTGCSDLGALRRAPRQLGPRLAGWIPVTEKRAQ